MRRWLTVGLLVVAFGGGLHGQTPQAFKASDSNAPAFEVATIQVNKSGDPQAVRRQPGGRITVTNIPARQLILLAYQLQPFQIVGGPSWIRGEGFDMVAKLDREPPPTLPDGQDSIMLAMRALLADRFKLMVHRERREMDIYALVLAKPASGPGAGLKTSTTDCLALAAARRKGGVSGPPPPGTPFCGQTGIPGQIRVGGTPLSQVAMMLGGMTGRLVVDRTGLTGNWDFTLTFQAEMRGQPGNNDVPAPDSTAPSIFTALQEQLGLKLESTKGPVDVLVIDRVEKPTAD